MSSEKGQNKALVSARPPFSALPLQPQGPPGNAWGLFGNDDQLGMLNLLTPETTLAATKEIVDGVRIGTDWPLDRMKMPCFGRQTFHQKIHHKSPRTVNDDILTFNTQSSSQWDGFRHYGYQKEKRYFNGTTQDDVQGSDKLGIHVWTENGGIIGRGVLLDHCSWAESQGISRSSFETDSIPLKELLAVAESQGTIFKPGDILLVRTGFTKSYEALNAAEAEALAAKPVPPAMGVASSEEVLQWFWETGFAAVAGDQPSFEAWPCQDTQFFLHEWLLAGWGLPIGELFDLERLADECRKRKKWTFFFSSVPLKVTGGVASPPNGMAIL